MQELSWRVQGIRNESFMISIWSWNWKAHLLITWLEISLGMYVRVRRWLWLDSRSNREARFVQVSSRISSVADLLWVEISSKPLQATMRIAECTSATEPTTFSCSFTRMLGGTKTTNLVLLERQRNGFGERMKSRVQSFNNSDIYGNGYSCITVC